MNWEAVVFDLYGTLVAPFRMREYIQALEEVANVLDVDFKSLHGGWIRNFPRRIRGEFPSVMHNLEAILADIGVCTKPAVLDVAEKIYKDFTLAGLNPKDGAAELLEWLRAQGIPVGLVSNCAPDVVDIWDRSRLAGYFSYCAFSCRERMVKPDPEIYYRTLRGIGSNAEQDTIHRRR